MRGASAPFVKIAPAPLAVVRRSLGKMPTTLVRRIWSPPRTTRALRKSLLKHKLHQDQVLFEKAYGYMRQHY